MKKTFLILFLSLSLTANENIRFTIDPKTTVEELSLIAESLGTENFELEKTELGYQLNISKKVSYPPRNYKDKVSEKEKSEIYYIVKTLANDNLIKIANNKSSLKKSGDKVDHVHPLKFLMTIFINEELKVCMRNLQGRSWVWEEFLDGVVSTLAKESTYNNVLPHVSDFATQVKINPNLIIPSLQAGKWREFVEILIENVPRSGDTGRYDM